MWTSIVLFIKRALTRGKIKKLAKNKHIKNIVNNLDKSASSTKLKKMLKADKMTTWAIRINLFIMAFTLIIALVLAIYIITVFGNLAGFSVLNSREKEQAEEEKNESNWEFNIDSIKGQDGILQVPGGIYPVDHDLREKAYLFQVIKRSSDDVKAETGVTVKPSWILGTFFRESMNGVFQMITASKDTSMLVDLMYKNPVCHKSKCSWIAAGQSHFEGGSVVNGKDTGDPYTQKVITDSTIYKKYNTKGGHAIGIAQFEVPYVYSHLGTRQFPTEDEFGISPSSAIGYRPNPFYLPDIVYSCAFLHARSIEGTKYWKKIADDADFKTLSDENKAFIHFMFEGAYYGRGSVAESDAKLGKELINIAKKYNINLADMLKEDVNKFYNGSNVQFNGSSDLARRLIAQRYPELLDYSGYTGWYGIVAACVGEAVWDKFIEDIYAGQNEQTGGTGGTGGIQANPVLPGSNQLGYIGSGQFKEIPGLSKNYYNADNKITMFWQTNSIFYAKWWDKSWGVTDKIPSTNNSSETVTLKSSGCGIYSTAFVISNLTGKLVTPGDLVKYGKENFKSFTLPLPNYRVITYAKAYGLNGKMVNTGSGDARNLSTFTQTVMDTLQKGGMVVSVWSHARTSNADGKTDNKFEWYNGKSAHFMVIRGYNKDTGNLRVYTSSWGAAGDPNKASAVELSPARVFSFLSTGSGKQMELIYP